MLKDVFTDVLTLLYVIKPVILNFFLMNSEKDDRVLVENKGEKEEARGDKEKSEDKEDEEDEEEDEEEEEDEDENDEEDGDEDEEDEDEEVVDGDCNKIPPELCSSNCHIHKLNLCKKKEIKLLYDYLESYSDKTKKFNIVNELKKGNDCSSLNKIIDLYNDRIKCQGEKSENVYCPYIKQFRNKHSHKTIEILKCTVNESSLPSQEHDYFMSTSQVKKPATGDQRKGNNNDICVLQCSSLVTEILDPETSDNDGAMIEKQAMGGNQSVRESHHAPSQITTSSEQNGSDTTISTSSTSCPHSTLKESCDQLLTTSKGTQREDTNELSQSSQRYTVDHTETDMDSQEETYSTSTIITSASSILGIPFLLFMLYKFTPNGSKINNRKRKKHIWKMNEEPYDQYLMYNPEIGNTNSNNNKYNIRYYSLIN
ncbi:PIR Superfamily Protein [Plasmodium ovale curtisi]|uniref:PIR Superfamily Protein n=1 Tax=Plasmodium ovale curtisi TaxID=864141 RepID=A0A1A8WPW8_PLAOA|nr:PIR Superfamily Protein [Plasmodium ovale curtisi]SBS99156.1 PIR Superfamily Protein [Plasmodium ovale curtisi]